MIIPPISQSAVIPYRHDNDQLRVLLITSRNTGRWIVPKGMVEPNMTPWASAAKEALEEAGLLGIVGQTKVCEYFYDKWETTFRVAVYPMRIAECLEDWEERELRRRAWMTPKQAARRVREKELSKAIQTLASFDTWPVHLP